MWTAFAAGVAGGLIYCLPLSAVNVEILRRGLTDGFLPSLLVSLGAIVGDAVWLAAAVLGAEALTHSPGVRLAVGAGGAALLLWFAAMAWRSAQREPELEPVPPIAGARAFGLGAMLCLANPYAALVLLAVIESVGARHAHGATGARYALYAGIFGGAVVYGFLAAGLSSWGRRFVTRRTLRYVDLTAAVLFVGLAALLVWQTARPVTVR